MWIARNEDETIYFFYRKPLRREDKGYWVSVPYGEQCMLEYDDFPEVTWKDGPIEVELIKKR